MSFAGFLNDVCDIYHLRTETRDAGYGAPPIEHAEYPDEPDVEAVPCHFARRGGGNTLVESVPERRLTGVLKLNLPYGTDVRLNDRIVDRRTGLAYTAAVPQNIRTHHVAVQVYRLAGQEAI